MPNLRDVDLVEPFLTSLEVVNVQQTASLLEYYERWLLLRKVVSFSCKGDHRPSKNPHLPIYST